MEWKIYPFQKYAHIARTSMDAGIALRVRLGSVGSARGHRLAAARSPNPNAGLSAQGDKDRKPTACKTNTVAYTANQGT